MRIAGWLVHLEVAVDVSHKCEGCQERHSAQHEEEDVAAKESVAKELNCLQSAVHVGPLHVVEESIHQHKQPCGPADRTHSLAGEREGVAHSPGGEDGAPPPAIVLGGQLEVGEGHRDAGRD